MPTDHDAKHAALLAEIGRQLDAIEAEMKRIGYWQNDPPPELLARLAAGEISSYLDPAITFEQYLQLVFMPAARRRVEEDDLPESSDMGVIAMRQYDYHSYVEEAQPLLALLSRLDELVENLHRPDSQER